jgi:branched-chain amino acid transport system permease protein
LLTASSPYTTVLMIDLLIAALFAASLHFIMGPAGMHSFGHAAYFGLGAYGAALLVRALGLSMEMALLVAPLVAAFGALMFGWFAVRLVGRLPGHAHAGFCANHLGGHLPVGQFHRRQQWPDGRVAFRVVQRQAHVLLAHPGLGGAGVLWLRRILFSPFGYALRAGRDSVLRADAIGIDVKRMQWLAFILAGGVAGLAGALYAFSKGSISPESLSVGKSVDGLVMVLLGGIQTLAGPVVGAFSFTWLHDVVARNTDYWRAMLGAIILILVLLFPQGIAGSVQGLWERLRSRFSATSSTAGGASS